MIRSFRHKGLKELFAGSESTKVRPDLQQRCLRRLDALHQASVPADLRLPGFDFHRLHGQPERYSIHVNGAVVHHLRVAGGRRLAGRPGAVPLRRNG